MQKTEKMLQARGSHEHMEGHQALPGETEPALSRADQPVQLREEPGKLVLGDPFLVALQVVLILILTVRQNHLESY